MTPVPKVKKRLSALVAVFSDWNKETGKMRPVAHTAGHAVEPEGFGTGTAVSPKYEQAASERSGCAEYGTGRMPPQHC